MTKKEAQSIADPIWTTTQANKVLAAFSNYANRRGLSDDDQEELVSFGVVRLLGKGDDLFRHFQGRASLSTYLHSVVHRLWIDFNTCRWGKWRPTARSRRLGHTVECLDRLIRCEGFGIRTATATVLSERPTKKSAETLRSLGAKLATQKRPRPVSLNDEAFRLAAKDAADAALEREECRQEADLVLGHLKSALQALKPEQRFVIDRWFFRQHSAKEIGKILGVDPKMVYRILHRALTEVRGLLEQAGIKPGNLRRALGPEGLVFPEGEHGSRSRRGHVGGSSQSPRTRAP